MINYRLEYQSVERNHEKELEVFKNDYKAMADIEKKAKEIKLDIEKLAIERGLAKREPKNKQARPTPKMPSYSVMMEALKALNMNTEEAFTELRNILWDYFLNHNKYLTSAGIERKRTKKQAWEKTLEETTRNPATTLMWRNK